ncbi:hypothetical protein OG393_17955 [Streptomyces sp. NBC_01216]|uniref:hypothetical protein n=1 Tax=Streptomyces sp. NBC_01216 TaxID=2903778 RepID=UPI002E0E5BBE|nr:hypothetical protein OG393_17955 [Streptomyces sp. NBC_01216]
MISEWLVQAHPMPGRALSEWSTRTVALLPLGRLLAAVRIEERLVHAAAGSDEPNAVADYLAGRLQLGPVIHDSGNRHYYALVPADAGRKVEQPGVRHLGVGTWVGIPCPDRTQPPGTYWSVAPRTPARLCHLADVADVANTGRGRLAALTSVRGTEAAE